MKLLEAIKQIEESNKKSRELNNLIAEASFSQDKTYYTYGFYVDNGTLKFYIRNKDGYRANFYYVTLKELIKDLKLLDKIIKEAELKKEKEESSCKK
ncbi:hypothetical protein LCGC14_1371650 [marine sediment metagenome]|uniref:Uncharacterized protein n=1 Tax=marine sediment metagenome TaxID=412755 RepID=A0A0F9K5L7_9ZZZZ